MKIQIGDTMTIRGCAWDDNWEFDCPFMIYKPLLCTGTTGGQNIDREIEDLLIDLTTSKDRKSLVNYMKKNAIEECQERGWGTNFKGRKNAWHTEWIVKFVKDEYGETTFELVSRRNQQGPFKD